MIREAMLYEREEGQKVRCRLCSHRCRISEDRFGFCGVRQNRDGILYTHVYGEVIAAQVDPIEKKPLYHFLPGTDSYSIATIGCNFRCDFCQNWSISQVSSREERIQWGKMLSSEEIVANARQQGCRSISYTYTEPTIFFEYAYDTARLAKDRGLMNVFVSNGYMTGEALSTIHPVLDACNIDLKSFRDRFYRSTCKARLKPVLESIERIGGSDIWMEITTLVVPGLNDSREELADIAKFIAGVNPAIPWHISRFYPAYRTSQTRATPEEKLREAREIGTSHGLQHVYLGNVAGEYGDIICPNCSKTVVKRQAGMREVAVHIEEGRCPFCGHRVAGVFR